MTSFDVDVVLLSQPAGFFGVFFFASVVLKLFVYE